MTFLVLIDSEHRGDKFGALGPRPVIAPNPIAVPGHCGAELLRQASQHSGLAPEAQPPSIPTTPSILLLCEGTSAVSHLWFVQISRQGVPPISVSGPTQRLGGNVAHPWTGAPQTVSGPCDAGRGVFVTPRSAVAFCLLPRPVAVVPERKAAPLQVISRVTAIG